MSEPIKLALTKEEWDVWHDAGQLRRDTLYVGTKGRGMLGLQRVIVQPPSPMDTECHAVAALCLYQQPFGFTQEDAEILRQIAPFVVGASIAQRDLRAWAHRLADRIAALLPPSE